MKALYAALAISLVAAAVPIALAEENCDADPPSEGFAHPTQKGRYLYIVDGDGGFDLDKFGEWSESNGIDGLQTEDCFYRGNHMALPDTHVRGLP